jgi:hypothetical protein
VTMKIWQTFDEDGCGVAAEGLTNVMTGECEHMLHIHARTCDRQLGCCAAALPWCSNGGPWAGMMKAGVIRMRSDGTIITKAEAKALGPRGCRGD